MSPDDKNKLHKTDVNPSPPQEYNKYANTANVTSATTLIHARDSRLSIMVSTQITEYNAPTLNTPVSRKLFNTSTVMREGVQRESTTASGDPIWNATTNAPTQSTTISQNIADKLSEQVREAAEREQEMLRVTTLLSEAVEEVE